MTRVLVASIGLIGLMALGCGGERAAQKAAPTTPSPAPKAVETKPAPSPLPPKVAPSRASRVTLCKWLDSVIPPKRLSTAALLRHEQTVRDAPTHSRSAHSLFFVAEHYRRVAASSGKERRKNQATLKAIKTYLVLQKPAFRSFSRRDEVLFHLATLQMRRERRDAARRSFAMLIRNYPRSRFVPWAYLAFAEYYYRANRWGHAQKLADRAMRFSDSPAMPYAVYLNGWALMKQKRYRHALERFVRVARDVRRWPAARLASKMLLEDSRHGTVLAFAEIANVRTALPFFRRVGGKHAKAMLRALVSVYLQKGRTREASLAKQKLDSL
jgi:tetratricopeptide (TPR) repeat protein